MSNDVAQAGEPTRPCSWCGREVAPGVGACPTCGCETLAPIGAPTTRVGPVGIGGWLLVFFVFLLLSPLGAGWFIYESATTLQADAGLPLPRGYRSALWSVLIGNAILLLYQIYIIPRFVRRVPGTVRHVITLLLLIIVLAGLPYVMILAPAARSRARFHAASALLTGYGAWVVIAFIKAAIWVPYFFLSKRVKNTFGD